MNTKNYLTELCAGVLLCGLCMGFVACNDPVPPNVPDNTRAQYPLDPDPDPDPNPNPNTYITEYYEIINQIGSDIVIEFQHSGKVMTIEPGETREIQKLDMVYEPGIAYSRDGRLGDIKIGSELMPDFIWGYEEYWNKVREDGEDDYHYSLTYTLTVTDELVESIVQRQAAIMHVTTHHKIVNQTGSDIVVELKFGDRQIITVKPGGMQVVHTKEAYLEPKYVEVNPETLGSATMLNAEFKKDGNTVPYLSEYRYWRVETLEYGEDNTCHRTYTLIITDELVKKLREEYDYKHRLM